MSDYIKYKIITDNAKGSGNNSSGGGCSSVLLTMLIILVLISSIVAISFSDVLAFLLMIFVPAIGLSFYSKFKKKRYQKAVAKGKTVEEPFLTDSDLIIVPVVSIIIFLLLMIGFIYLRDAFIYQSYRY